MQCLRFRFTHMVIRLIQRQDDAELQLFTHPAKIGEHLAGERFEVRLQQMIIFLHCPHYFRRRQIQFSQPLSGAAYRFKEMQPAVGFLKRSRRSAGGN